jgi:hypothetical protein
MSADMSKWLGNKVLRWMAGNAMPSPPTDVYLALYDGDPRTSGTEITTTVRPAGRLPISFAALVDGTGNELDSNADVDFGASAGDVTLSYVAVFDDNSDTEMLWVKQLVGGPFAVATGTPVKFLSGDLTFTVGA